MEKKKPQNKDVKQSANQTPDQVKEPEEGYGNKKLEGPDRPST